MFPETIETDRLSLTPARLETLDVHEVYEICSADPAIEEITEYVTWSPHETPKETHEFLAGSGSQWDDREAVHYVIRPRESEDGAGEIAGFTGFNVDWEKQSAELGVWLRKRFWGRSYSAERAIALADAAFEAGDLEVVSVRHHPDNEKSRRAVEKYVDRLGGRREGLLRNHLTFTDGSVHDAVRYTISREEWKEARGEA